MHRKRNTSFFSSPGTLRDSKAAAKVFSVSSILGNSSGNSSLEEQQQTFFDCCCSFNRPKLISFCRVASSVYLPSKLNARPLRSAVPDRNQLVNFFSSSRSQGLPFTNPKPPTHLMRQNPSYPDPVMPRSKLKAVIPVTVEATFKVNVTGTITPG